MRTEREIRDESRRIRERAKALSGFWIPELSAAAYALEWALGKREQAPSQDIGSPDSGQGKLAESLVKAAEKEATQAQKAARAKKPRPPVRAASSSHS
jgi:hypothetical protein